MKNHQDLLRLLKDLRVYDLSPTFETNMPGWPYHPPMLIVPDAHTFELQGDLVRVLLLPEHAGSHVDAPAHAISSMRDATIDRYKPDYLIGQYKKYDLTRFDLKAGDFVTLEMITKIEDTERFAVEADDIILLNFGWDKYYHPESSNATERAWWGANEPGLSEEVCKYFADSKIRAIGADTSACEIAEVGGVVKSEFGHMKYFLPNHILIIEGLQNLSAPPSTGIFIALPLKIKGGSGSPIRPIAISS